jgi:ATP-dependent Clp protease ATP-binding subunit ClpA
LLLGILDKATLTLGDNRRVDFSQTMIFMTSNLGSNEITDLMMGGMGFAPLVRADSTPRLDEKVKKTASEAAKRKFAPEFMNRIDKTIVFHPLRTEQLEQILEIELEMVQRVLETARGRFLFRATQPAREFLLKEGTDLKYGARHLKRAIELHLVYRLANLLSILFLPNKVLECIRLPPEEMQSWRRRRSESGIAFVRTIPSGRTEARNFLWLSRHRMLWARCGLRKRFERQSNRSPS